MAEFRYDELDAAAGATLGPSSSIMITQARIDAFADATEDRQWIHTDPDRAATGPFGTTIGHGFLTLSLCSAFLDDILLVTGADSIINYGSDRVRFPSPVPVDSELYATGEIVAVTPNEGWTQLTVRLSIHRQGGERPACVVDQLIRYIAPVGV